MDFKTLIYTTKEPAIVPTKRLNKTYYEVRSQFGFELCLCSTFEDAVEEVEKYCKEAEEKYRKFLLNHEEFVPTIVKK